MHGGRTVNQQSPSYPRGSALLLSGRRVRFGNAPDPQKIAEEAVGQRPETAIPDAAKESAITSDQIREQARSAGRQASVAALTAEAVGERDDGAYAYDDATSDEVRKQEASLQIRRRSGVAFREPRYVAVIAGFALGYAAALLIHRRR